MSLARIGGAPSQVTRNGSHRIGWSHQAAREARTMLASPVSFEDASLLRCVAVSATAVHPLDGDSARLGDAGADEDAGDARRMATADQRFCEHEPRDRFDDLVRQLERGVEVVDIDPGLGVKPSRR